MKYKDYCPNCDKNLEIVEEDQVYVIVDDGHAVTNCPDCLIPLLVEDGVLVEDK